MELTMDRWARSVRSNLIAFLKELKTTCLAVGRKPDSVKVVYATKYLGPEQFVAFLHIGKEIDILPVTIGENRIQEAEEKLRRLEESDKDLTTRCHPVMIGTMQKNKINKAIRLFEEIHSIDSVELAEALDNRLNREKLMPIFLEINVSGETNKHGFGVEELDRAILEVKSLKFLRLTGLMTMAPWVTNPEEVRPVFRTLRQLANRYGLLTSMGMSNDWKVAVKEGADMIRIGGKIFRS
ncbi:YggS family pyridoxal phosphate-dependent enzyme [Candidatus Gottesmanbacteria bacterium]|nr:YggS family pyridoxal phosphate-dependent enzyme [Candidatus Gottesmanbacteria bacterium]